jgi:hypothetical protein
MTSTLLADHPASVIEASTPVVVFGCHGGAGTTTLAGLLGPNAHEAGLDDQAAVADVAGRAVIVVARGTAAGCRLAVCAAARLTSAGADPVVVAVVADGPWPEPLAARARLRALAGHVPVVRVPYVARWRFEDSPTVVPARYDRAVVRLRAAYCRCTDAHQPSTA